MRLHSIAAHILAAALLLASTVPAGALTDRQVELYGKAIDAAEDDRFDEARRLADQGGEPLLDVVVEWLRLSDKDSKATFQEIAAFLAAHPEWDGDDSLMRRAEEGMSLITPSAQILEWFRTRPPRTADGKMELARSLIGAGQREAAATLLRETWLDGDLGDQQEENFLKRFGSHLKPGDHQARLDRLLWKRSYTAARRMLPRVEVGYRALAEARIKLAGMQAGVDAAIDRVPKAHQGDPGLLYERIRWRRRKGRDEEATELLLKAPVEEIEAGSWWVERNYQARRLLQEGYFSEAYQIAANHGRDDGIGFAEGEWLAGWIALRFLQEPDLAFKHFNTMHLGVRYAISLSRAAYWSGRAAEAMGLGDTARQWYAKAAEHVGTYYGQLAASRLPPDLRPHYLVPPPIDQGRRAAFEATRIVRTARLLAALDADDLTRRVLLHLYDRARDRDERLLAGELAVDLGRPDVAVRAARESYRDGMNLVPSGYPVVPLPAAQLEPALAHALIRQESGFLPDAISSAGARGLMQLMPGTAKRTAQSIGMPYSAARLTDDPTYNMTLGQAHFEELLEEFGGSYVLALAAYNAGSHRARRWIVENGDPRDVGVDAIDWIELIPFSETRNYVQRVLENLQVYRWRMNGTQMAATPHDRIFGTGGLTQN